MAFTRPKEELEFDLRKLKRIRAEAKEDECSFKYKRKMMFSCDEIGFFRSLKYLGNKPLAKEKCQEAAYEDYLKCCK